MEIVLFALMFVVLGLLGLAVIRFQRRRIEAASDSPLLTETQPPGIKEKLEALGNLQEYYVNSAALAAAALSQWMMAEVEKVLLDNGEIDKLTMDPAQAKAQYFILRARHEEALILFQVGANGVVLPTLQKKAEAERTKHTEESPEESPDASEVSVPKPPKGNLPN